MDERGLLSASIRKEEFGALPQLRRGFTFVDKLRLQSRPSYTIEDVLYRRFFGETPKLVRSGPSFKMKFEKEELETEFKDEAVIVVDTFSTGASLAHMLYKAGYHVVCVLSGELEGLLDMMPEGLDFSFAGTILYDSKAEESVAFGKVVGAIQALKWPVVAVFAGAETGVELSDKLSEHLGLRTNGTALSEARRNKYVMGETIRAAGVRAVKQLRASTWGEISSFIAEWNPDPFKVIVKPMDSAGSDGVTLCLSLAEVETAFGNIMGKVNGLGLVNKAVLVQEYLEGPEYVVDMVSRDGEHKVVALWLYDRRASNGAGFVNFGQRLLVPSEDPCCRPIIDYQRKVLDALGIFNGPSHGEVKWFKGEPVLVEVGARCHGVEGAWQVVAHAVYGFEQIQAAVDSYLFPEAFAALPVEVRSFLICPLFAHHSNLGSRNAPHGVVQVADRRCYGALLFLQSNVCGRLVEINPAYIEEIRAMPSFVHMELFARLGQQLKKTIDCFTFGGIVKLVHAQSEVLEKDYNRIREMENSGLFLCE